MKSDSSQRKNSTLIFGSTIKREIIKLILKLIFAKLGSRAFSYFYIGFLVKMFFLSSKRKKKYSLK